ncbi:ATP-binding cassette domain-containing protein [Gelidibacter maritimus]|uniref:ATP-binding cassette domain-containing protein n=1 Tax=Gelidibacter maritimus TaxID=2761487 RepID=A0A7W2M591_9FLAO|nr:energy-coupling factor ABC transporter ATP-binding protein [Gelidibacter maritimus]MBA6152975.1 ATP-binding cassette domain-containing protein [Gelidibacter maritimus]
MIIELDSIELYFKERRILNGIYLKAETGQIVGILGRNGSGKSCLLQILFGSLKPKYKLVRLDKKPLKRPLYTLNMASYLPQHQLAPDHLKVKTLFQMMNLEWNTFVNHFEKFQNYYNTRISKLSGGERRVIETYSILKREAAIVLLDEPFSNISPLHIEKIKKLIEIEKSEKIIIITDHYFNDVIDMSDTLYLLKNGCTKIIDNLEELEDYNYINPGKLKARNGFHD